MLDLKFAAICLILVASAPLIRAGDMKCALGNPQIPVEWIDMRPDCVTAMRDQIQKEINASYRYLAMASYFSRDTVNRPGFSEMFFKSAKEEREHGAKLIEYLSMRGKLTDDVTDLIRIPIIDRDEWVSGAEALEDALKLETEVTKSIRKVIQICEKKYNDYHLVDYLTEVYLDEQLKSQRDLAGKLSTLKKMMSSQGELGEFLFDKNL